MTDEPNSTEVTIRRATPADAGTGQTLLLELASHEGDAEHVQVTEADWRGQLGDPDVVVYLAYVGDELAGYVSATRRRYLWGGGWMIGLDDAYVRAEFRGRGVGEQLMSRMAAHAAVERLLIRWELEVDNAGAERFYGRLGATVRAKKVAVWTPDAYAAQLRCTYTSDGTTQP